MSDILSELSQKDGLWRKIAIKICDGDKNLADDIVQEMYLRRLDNDRGQQTTDYYIACTMRSIFLNMKKKNKLILVGEIVTEKTTDERFEPSDEQQKLLNRVKQLSFTKRELLELNYENSLRDIQDTYGINYMYVHRAINDARKQILGDKIHQYRNKRLKHVKMVKSEGLGDTIEKITRSTGIKKLVELATGGKDCGCDKRKEALNRLFNYKLKPECLTNEQIKDYKQFIDTRNIVVLSRSKANGTLSKDQIKFITGLYSVVFNTKKWQPECSSCSGTSKKLIDMIYKLDTVFVNNLPNKKTKEQK